MDRCLSGLDGSGRRRLGMDRGGRWLPVSMESAAGRLESVDPGGAWLL